MELYSIDVDGSNNTSFGISAFHAAFSPDGKKIAFANSTISGNYDIYIMNLDGTGLTQITTYTERDMAPDW